MKGIVARRLLMLVPLVWLVVTLTFIVVQAAPGSYADTIDNPRLSPETRAAVRAHYGADEPFLDQYLRWLGAVATGDLGVSFMYREPVTRVLARALPPTVLLAGSGLAITLLLGLVLAVASARKPYGWADRAISFFSLGLYGVPSFWLAGGLIMVFSLRLGWLPPSHMHSVGASELSPIGSLRRPPPPPGASGHLPRTGWRRRHRPLSEGDPAGRSLVALHARRPRPRPPGMAACCGSTPCDRRCCRS